MSTPKQTPLSPAMRRKVPPAATVRWEAVSAALERAGIPPCATDNPPECQILKIFRRSLVGNKFIPYICDADSKIQNNSKNMPTLFILLGLRFFFYSNDHEPIHVHVSRDNAEAKYRIGEGEIILVENRGLKAQDLKIAQQAIRENREIIIDRWNEYFNDEQ